jgi:dihydroorotate dehydrogenase
MPIAGSARARALVQLYSRLVYRGPGLARSIVRELKALLERDGFSKAIEAIGEP